MFDFPYTVYAKLFDDGLFGLSRAMCKVMSLENFTTEERMLAQKFWNRALLHPRRKISGKKAAYRRKGYIADYGEVPDFREDKFHESVKRVYDLNEVER